MAKPNNIAAGFNLPQREAVGAHSIPTEPIRFTVDLDPVLHGQVFGWAGAQYMQAGVKVDVANTVRDLLAELIADTNEGQALRESVLTRAKARAAERRANRLGRKQR